MERYKKNIVVSIKNPDGTIKDSRSVDVDVVIDNVTGEECLDGTAIEKLYRAKAEMRGLDYDLEIKKSKTK